MAFSPQTEHHKLPCIVRYSKSSSENKWGSPDTRALLGAAAGTPPASKPLRISCMRRPRIDAAAVLVCDSGLRGR